MMDIKDIKKEWNATILDILKAFMKICKDNELTYYCCAGTAIGAVRHHGIIPWDDDIDVIMPRPDYDRLLEIAKTANFGKYEIITPYDDETYPLYFSKLSNRNTTLIEDRQIPCVIGLYVDIFPLDATDDDVAKAKRLKDRYTKIINRLNAVSTHNTFGEYLSLLKKKEEWGRFAIKTLAFFCRSAMRRHLIRQMDRLSHLYDYDKAKNVQVYTGSYGHREVFPKSWLGKGKEFPFEDTTVLLPECYDEYLRHFFNDYMQFPPVEQRIEKHNRAYLNIHKKETREEIRKKVDFRI
ncbi:LicD family protein [uncultured Prevotella sp.]|uniref:LicD family protein n=1 Tax=uncultured Prevotella sp. TaxID=159272 RepID=UPI00260DBCB9|nr:LicD family protein [uncultured Prevotella sp.]